MDTYQEVSKDSRKTHKSCPGLCKHPSAQPSLECLVTASHDLGENQRWCHLEMQVKMSEEPRQ